MKPNPFSQLPQGSASAVLLILGVILIGVVLIYIIYLKNLQDLLKNIKPENRKMAPGKVWLMLISFVGLFFVIPEVMNINLSEAAKVGITVVEYAVSLFTLVWNFYMINKIADSLAAELASRNLAEQIKPTYAIGMFLCGCNTLGLVGGVPNLDWLAMVAGGAGFVAWIMYWLKTSEYKQKLAANY